ncbi:MAG: hypothetical protein LBN18_02210 [Dysgonamonadaceae bacterium]|jgi:hypothetical protein|nr:hypothetical protein [Dysgonamonadaceae bacterium]
MKTTPYKNKWIVLAMLFVFSISAEAAPLSFKKTDRTITIDQVTSTKFGDPFAQANDEGSLRVGPPPGPGGNSGGEVSDPVGPVPVALLLGMGLLYGTFMVLRNKQRVNKAISL